MYIHIYIYMYIHISLAGLHIPSMFFFLKVLKIGFSRFVFEVLEGNLKKD